MGQNQDQRVGGLAEDYEWATGDLDRLKLLGQSGVLCLWIFNEYKSYQKKNQFRAVIITL